MLIDLREHLNEHYISIGISMALQKMEGFKPADAVEVVRCRECMNWQSDWECASGGPGDHFCTMIGRVTKPDFYCKHGEKLAVKEGR